MVSHKLIRTKIDNDRYLRKEMFNVSKQVYISADYSESEGDREVVETLNKWAEDNLHKVDFVDMSKVVSGSVSKDPDCRICDLKKEFNSQINASSAVIIVVGDKTATRTAGSACERNSKGQDQCKCTPYKQNRNGLQSCKVKATRNDDENGDLGYINTLSYLRHEFEQARKKNKLLIVLYNSKRKETDWLPSYMKDYQELAVPFWITNKQGEKVGNYAYIKEALGFD